MEYPILDFHVSSAASTTEFNDPIFTFLKWRVVVVDLGHDGFKTSITPLSHNHDSHTLTFKIGFRCLNRGYEHLYRLDNDQTTGHITSPAHLANNLKIQVHSIEFKFGH